MPCAPREHRHRLSSELGPALRIPWEPVLRDGLPRRRVLDELPVLRPNPRIAVERPEADARRLAPARRPAEERGSALRAEPLVEAVRGLEPLHALLPLEDPDGTRREPRLGRGRRSRPPLAARAVAVRRGQRLRHLEAHAAAEAASGERGHENDGSSTSVTSRPSEFASLTPWFRSSRRFSRSRVRIASPMNARSFGRHRACWTKIGSIVFVTSTRLRFVFSF